MEEFKIVAVDKFELENVERVIDNIFGIFGRSWAGI